VWTTLKRFQEDLQASESILVVGGGASGVEYAAEVASQYPDKRVTVSDRVVAASKLHLIVVDKLLLTPALDFKSSSTRGAVYLSPRNL
jgi:NADH dehydrogenase FAD-containing subunit